MESAPSVAQILFSLTMPTSFHREFLWNLCVAILAYPERRLHCPRALIDMLVGVEPALVDPDHKMNGRAHALCRRIISQSQFNQRSAAGTLMPASS